MASSDSEDAQLRAAIAASLRDSQPQGQPASDPPAQSAIIDLTNESNSEHEYEVKEVFPKSNSVVGSDTDKEASDDDDEELKAALALSLEGVHHSDDDESCTTAKASAEPQASEQAPQPSGFLGMDRKKMEQERLARLAKRKADTSNESLSPGPTKFMKTGPITSGSYTETASPSRKEPTTDICNQFAANDPSCSVKPTARPVPQWPLGTVKRTAVWKARRLCNDITIEEVLQRGDLELAVLSSFMWDMEWLFSKTNTWQTQFFLVMQAKEEKTRRQYREETAAMKNIHLCFPPMEGQVNCMHSKLMLLFHPNYLRIAVPTANLTAVDWGEHSLMENTVFLIDLPKKAEEDMGPNSRPRFYHDLVYFLEATTLHQKIIEKLQGFDFSKTARYAFVHSIGGSHRDEAWKHTGYCGLGRAVTSLGLRSTAPIKIDYVTSSVGSLTGDFLRAIHLACKGDNGRTDYTLRNDKKLLSQTESPNRPGMANSANEWTDRFNVYFPSEATVRATHNNPSQTAGTICFQSSFWEKATFPHHVLRDCEGERGVLMHNKLIYVTPSTAIPLQNKTKCKGWAYVGSANLSESAWGRLVKDRETKKPRLNCRNWECGVIVPVTSECTEADTNAKGTHNESQRGEPTNIEGPSRAQFARDIFSGKVPVPMKTPAKNISPPSDRGKTGYRKPWFFME